MNRIRMVGSKQRTARWSVSLRVKLIGGFCAILVLLLGIGYMSLSRMNDMGALSEQISEDHMPAIALMNQVNEDLAAVENQVLWIVMDSEASRRDGYILQLNEMTKTLAERLEQLGTFMGDGENQLYESFTTNWSTYAKGIPAMIQNSQGADIGTRNKLLNDARPNMIGAKDSMHNLVLRETQAATSDSVKSVDLFKSASKIIMLLTIIAIVGGAAIAVYCLWSILPPLRRLGGFVRQVAQGELTNETMHHSRQDEIGELVRHFNGMKMSLRTMISQTRQSAEEVAVTAETLLASAEQNRQASKLISDSIEEVADDLERQAGISTEARYSADEIAKGMEQISGSVMEVTDSSAEVVKRVTHGNQVVQQTVLHMHGVDDKVKLIADTVRELGASMKKIEESVEAITSITRQTNILALNAGIEASRAGEQGKAFIVLAAEIRKLAEQSSAFTGHISERIGQISQLTKRAVVSTEDGSTAVREGMRVVEEAGQAFSAIAQAIEGVATQTEEMSAVVQQVNAGTQMMAISFGKIEQAAVHSAATSQTVASAAEEQYASVTEIHDAARALSQMSSQLRESIASFKLD